jgi:UDP-N-acetylmuramoyl-L-alanyl-D-glutamate--2,6-diaminopimelate ligase
MLLKTALEQIPGIDPAGIPDVRIDGISFDSRKVRKGDLFVAIRGEKADGACFVKQAAARGAAAIAAERPVDPEGNAPHFIVPDARKFLAEISRIFHEDPASKLNLVAVTGTNGKTTTTCLMDSIFSHAGILSCLAGTLGMKTASRTFPSRHTTPESSDLMQFLQQAVTEGCTHGALEVSSHSLALKRVFGVKFKVGIFMNLTPDHLDFHKTMEDYFNSKLLLFSPENGNSVESAVINTDDPYGKQLENIFHGPVLRFGFDCNAEVHVLECRIRAGGTDLRLATPRGDILFRTGLIGRHNAYNIMAATGAAICLGINPDKVREGIDLLKGVPGRCECVDAGQDYTVIVDYAHSPDALENLLNLVSQLPHERILTVFGCGGDRDKGKRPVMGSIAVRKSDISIVTSDNPRSENPLDIIDEIESGMHRGPGTYRIEPDRRAAIGQAIASAGKGDIVVIAGKGHEDYQIIGNSRNPFDDRKVAWELIRKHLNNPVRTERF